VSIAVENTGNVRLKPAVGFTLFDAAGGKISQATVQMDTFYAHTDTFVEMPLASLLSPGTYAVRLTLDDSSDGARAEDDRIALVVEAPTESAAGEGTVPGLIEVIQNTGRCRSLSGSPPSSRASCWPSVPGGSASCGDNA
jgi:hypothetical protein